MVACPSFQDLSLALKRRLAIRPAKMAAVMPPAEAFSPPVKIHISSIHHKYLLFATDPIIIEMNMSQQDDIILLRKLFFTPASTMSLYLMMILVIV